MSDRSTHVTTLIPAAGSGTRLGGKRKQYRRLGDESLLSRVLRLFDEHPRVDSIVVAVPPSDLTFLEKEFAERRLRKLHGIVPGGETRQASVAAAFDAAPSSADIVLIHDAARPFLPPDRIDAVIDAANAFGGAALAVPESDTLRRVVDAYFSETVRREGIYRMQTPQGFRRDWFAEAVDAARRDDHIATDDVALVGRIGRPVRVVRGSTLNFKVTTSEDWLLAEALWHHLATTP